MCPCSETTPDTKKLLEEQKTNYEQVPHPQVNPQWQPSMNVVPAVPNAMWNTPVYGQPPQSFQQHPLMQGVVPLLRQSLLRQSILRQVIQPVV